MLSKLTFALLAATVAAKVSHERLGTYNFEQFVREFRHPWSSDSKEYKMREALFNVELDRIRAHNEDSSKSWKETVNHFTAYTAAEKKVSVTRLFLLY
jgi:cathepsin L